MPLGLSEERAFRRRRRRFWGGLFKWSFLLGLVTMAGFYAYDVGTMLATTDVRRLEDEIARVRVENATLRQENTAQQAALNTGQATITHWEQRYARDIPSPEMKRVMDTVQQRLDAGVDSDRIAFVVAAAQNEVACDYGPVTKRFVLTTPIYQSAANSVRFAEDAIVVTGEGEPEKNADGNPFAWFDPALPVTIRFAHISGQTSQITGVLPLRRSIVVDDSEYRFNIVAGARSFVEITGDRCAYP